MGKNVRYKDIDARTGPETHCQPKPAEEPDFAGFETPLRGLDGRVPVVRDPPYCASHQLHLCIQRGTPDQNGDGNGHYEFLDLSNMRLSAVDAVHRYGHEELQRDLGQRAADHKNRNSGRSPYDFGHDIQSGSPLDRARNIPDSVDQFLQYFCLRGMGPLIYVAAAVVRTGFGLDRRHFAGFSTRYNSAAPDHPDSLALLHADLLLHEYGGPRAESDSNSGAAESDGRYRHRLPQFPPACTPAQQNRDRSRHAHQYGCFYCGCVSLPAGKTGICRRVVRFSANTVHLTT